MTASRSSFSSRAFSAKADSDAPNDEEGGDRGRLELDDDDDDDDDEEEEEEEEEEEGDAEEDRLVEDRLSIPKSLIDRDDDGDRAVDAELEALLVIVAS